MLVERLASRWGVHEGTTRVWFEMSAKASALAREAHAELGEWRVSANSIHRMIKSPGKRRIDRKPSD